MYNKRMYNLKKIDPIYSKLLKINNNNEMNIYE